MIIIKTLIAQLKSRRLLTLTLIFSLTITLVFVSILYSTIIYNNQIYEVQNNGYLPDKTIEYMLNCMDKKNYKIDKSSFARLCNKVDVKLRFQYGFGKSACNVQMVYSKSKEPEVILYNDRSITKAKNNYAYLGNDIRDEFKKYVEINGVQYNLAEVAGVKNKRTTFDDAVTIYTDNADYLLKAINENSLSNGILVSLYSRDLNDNIRENFESIFTTEYFDVKESVNKGSKLSAMKDENSKQILLLILVGLLSVITISTFWIIDRHKEISIKKAFGAKDKHVIFEIYKELLIICIFCGVLSMIVNLFICRFQNIVNFIEIKVSLYNIFVCFIGIIVISIITSIFPIYNALRQEIISGIKGGR